MEDIMGEWRVWLSSVIVVIALLFSGDAWAGEQGCVTPDRSASLRDRVPPQLRPGDGKIQVEISCHGDKGDSPVTMVVVDPRGRRLGERRGRVVHSIPSGSIEEMSLADADTGLAGPMSLRATLVHTISGVYELRFAGVIKGRYGFEMSVLPPFGPRECVRICWVAISPGEEHRYRMAIGETDAISGFVGAFVGSRCVGQRESRFLSYGYPRSSSVVVRCRKKAAAAHFVVCYGASVDASSFRAQLNGGDVSRCFHPSPGAIERVKVPLKRAFNKLRMSVEGWQESGTICRELDVFSILVFR